MRDAREVLVRPVVTERSTNLLADNKYTFYVNRDANKIEIKHAVEQMFKVNVTDVRTMVVKGKEKRRGRYVGRTSDRKKAIVTLRPGDRIAIFEGM
ncbi:MAG: 50S ribosomal protein L23 [Syntrophomonadaceae bacterium]|nr:50S ribosomal protein L23 [Syntrophomonadaceae bacterium]